MCGCLECLLLGPDPQPRHVPWLGIEPVTLWFAGCHSFHWTIPTRAKAKFLNEVLSSCIFCTNLGNVLVFVWGIYLWASGSLWEESKSSLWPIRSYLDHLSVIIAYFLLALAAWNVPLCLIWLSSCMRLRCYPSKRP